MTSWPDQPMSIGENHYMMVTTTFDFAGYRIREYKGLVRGIIVRSPTIKQGCLGGFCAATQAMGAISEERQR